AAQEKVEQMVASAGSELMKVIGRLESDWKASYSEECNLGQFEADAFRMKAGSDIAFINGGGLRKNLLKGDITVGDIWEINPFGNTIVTFSVKGKTLLEMIKNRIMIKAKKKCKGESSEMLNVSGLSYSYNSALISCSDTVRIPENLIISSNIGRTTLDPQRTYTIATNNYITAQFKKFFGDISKKIKFTDTQMIDRVVIIEAVENLGVINSVLEKRVVDVSGKK
ncbi:MAG: 5'-nucleotidase C-terminal domain-containing protein, partial [Ignavibacteria bacterium]